MSLPVLLPIFRITFASVLSAILAGCISQVQSVENKPKVKIHIPPTGNDAPLATTQKPTYRLLKLTRESCSDFSYRFSLFLMEKCDAKTLLTLKQELRKEILKDYKTSFAVTDKTSLHVDFPEFGHDETGFVEGRATILSATPTALMDYDAYTRHGKITVRFNTAIGSDAARKWAREHIEDFACDKNIVLTSGVKPSPGHYISLAETWRENVLEIEFKVE